MRENAKRSYHLQTTFWCVIAYASHLLIHILVVSTQIIMSKQSDYIINNNLIFKATKKIYFSLSCPLYFEH